MGQVTERFCASVSTFVQWVDCVRIKGLNLVTCFEQCPGLNVIGALWLPLCRHYHCFCPSIRVRLFVIVPTSYFASLLPLWFHHRWHELPRKTQRTWHSSEMYWAFFMSYPLAMTHCYPPGTVLFSYNVEMGKEGRVLVGRWKGEEENSCLQFDGSGCRLSNLKNSVITNEFYT